MFGILTLITGLALSAVAAFFAIVGIMAIFAGLPMYAMIMGIVVEAGKVVGVTWIYRHWTEKTKLKYVMIPVVIVAMLLTSMGIFGLLSKAHLEQTAPVANNSAKIERLDQRIVRERTEIADAELIIDQLDDTVRVLVDARKISHPTEGSKIVRINQQPQRDQLKAIINESFDSIDEYEDEKLTLNQELNEIELEIGPVKYIAAIIYEEPENNIDEAVRIVIIAFIFVFDPMAILLLMAGNYTLMGRIGTAPVRPKPKGIVPNADTEFVPAKVIAEVMAEVIDEKMPPKPRPPENMIVKEHELPPKGAPKPEPPPARHIKESEMGELAEKAKAKEIPAAPTKDPHKAHGHGVHSKQFYKE